MLYCLISIFKVVLIYETPMRPRNGFLVISCRKDANDLLVLFFARVNSTTTGGKYFIRRLIQISYICMILIRIINFELRAVIKVATIFNFVCIIYTNLTKATFIVSTI